MDIQQFPVPNFHLPTCIRAPVHAFSPIIMEEWLAAAIIPHCALDLILYYLLKVIALLILSFLLHHHFAFL